MSDLHRLSGPLPPRWLGNLAYELSRRGADVISVRAELNDGSWHVQLSLDPDDDAPRFTDAELLRMTAGEGPPESTKGSAPKISISSFEITPDAGSLRVSVMGDDRLGFLAALCAHFAQLALFPVKVDVRSYAARAHDTFWLGGVGGAMPLDETVTALKRLLRKMTGHPLSSRPPAPERSPAASAPGTPVASVGSATRVVGPGTRS